MVRQVMFLLLLLPALLFSGEFNASVSRNQVSKGENFTLTLTLKGASSKGSPSLGSLKDSFQVISQQQSTNTKIINGQMTSSMSWKIFLSPLKDGDLIIPEISLNTSAGILSTQPVPIKVSTTAQTKVDTSDTSGVTITAELSNLKPYKNEPLTYTIKVLSQLDLANVNIQKFEIENAVAELNGDPNSGYKVFSNENYIEFSYLITPLKAGTLKIPPVVIQGAVPMRRSSVRRSSFFDDDDYDPFFAMPGFIHLEPFTLSTKETTLNVQPPTPNMNPWIPAKTLKIEEIWNDNQLIQVGEPLARKFKITVEGNLSSQLPNLNDLLVSNDAFKIYADKPELSNEVKNGMIKGTRIDQYTIIPQKAGEVTLPEISVSWWNTTTNESNVTTVPPRTLNVASAPIQVSAFKPEAEQESPTVTGPPQRDPLLYVFVGGLAVLLLAAIFWVIALQKKIGRLTEKPLRDKLKTPEKKIQKRIVKPIPEKKDKNEKLPDLNPT